MAQASSAQREPSMEEILASIRRIIEDSDPTRGEGSLTAFSPLEEDHDEDEEVGAAIAKVENFRAELRTQRDFIAPSAPTGLADVEVSLRDGIEKASDDLEAAAAGSLGIETPAEAPGAADLGAGAGEEKPAEAAPPQVSYPVESADHEDAESQEMASTKPVIISDSTGRRVAAAFEELNEAVEATRRQSLDQMAEEMLRPMLQDWLDNNLPTLVEKLVREEIERVARGT